jgi:hypothetical protein
VSPRRRTAPACALFAAAAALAWAFRPSAPPAAGPAAPWVEVAPDGPLDARVAAVHRLVARKCALADELLAGRLGLADAVERVLAAEAGEPEAQAEARRTRARYYPGYPEREGVARNLARYAAARAPDPGGGEAVADWLRWELDLYLSGAGPADLSRPGPGGPVR